MDTFQFEEIKTALLMIHEQLKELNMKIKPKQD